MNAPRASLAIARRGMSPAFAFAWLTNAVVGLALGVAAGHNAGVLVFGTAFVATLTVQTRDVRDLTLFAAPLYGRQLARALAVPPCILALAFPGGATLAMLARGWPPGVALGTATALGGIVAALISLSGAIRTGKARWLYGALAIPGALLGVLPVWFGLPHALALSLGIALVMGFVALRAFGETLARYDPID